MEAASGQEEEGIPADDSVSDVGVGNAGIGIGAGIKLVVGKAGIGIGGQVTGDGIARTGYRDEEGLVWGKGGV